MYNDDDDDDDDNNNNNNNIAFERNTYLAFDLMTVTNKLHGPESFLRS
jgi:hypothetical protein